MQTQEEERAATLAWNARKKAFEDTQPPEVVTLARLICNSLGWTHYVWTDEKRPHIQVMEAFCRSARAVLASGGIRMDIIEVIDQLLETTHAEILLPNGISLKVECHFKQELEWPWDAFGRIAFEQLGWFGLIDVETCALLDARDSIMHSR